MDKRNTKTSAAVKNRYNSKAYDRINFVIKKGNKEIVEEIAKASNESTNAFIKNAVKMRIKAETGKDIEL